MALAEAATVTLSEDKFTSQAAHRVKRDQTGAGLSESDGGALHVRESAAQPEKAVRQINFKSNIENVFQAQLKPGQGRSAKTAARLFLEN